MDIRTIAHDVRIVKIMNDATGTTDRNSEVIDTAGYNRLCVIVSFGTIASSANMTLRLRSSATASDENTLTGIITNDTANQIVGIAQGDSNKLRFIDLLPRNRYYQLQLLKGGISSSEDALVLLYHGDDAPVSHGAGGTAIGQGTASVGGIVDGIEMQLP